MVHRKKRKDIYIMCPWIIFASTNSNPCKATQTFSHFLLDQLSKEVAKNEILK